MIRLIHGHKDRFRRTPLLSEAITIRNRAATKALKRAQATTDLAERKRQEDIAEELIAQAETMTRTLKKLVGK